MTELGQFVNSLEKHIKNDVADHAVRTDDTLVNLERLITEREAGKLIKTYRGSELRVTKESLAPFKEFLNARWNRVKGTDADVASFPDSYANLLCNMLAHAIARMELHKSKASQAEANAYFVPGDFPDDSDLTDDESKRARRERRLSQNIGGCASILFASSAELLELMTTKLHKDGWASFLQSCDLDTLKGIFLGSGFINDEGDIYSAVAKLATDDHTYGADANKNVAILYCLIEIYKRERAADPNTYRGIGGGWTGVQKNRRLSQATRLQEFLASDSVSLNDFMRDFPDDNKPFLRYGTLGQLATQTSKIKSFVPPDLASRPSIQQRAGT